MERFKATLKLNNNVVGVAIGETKQKSKLNVCRHALAAMVSELYEDWKKEHGGSMQLKIQNKAPE